MTTGELLPVHLGPVWSVIVQTDRHGHSTPPRLKVMSWNDSETSTSGSCAPVRANQCFAYSRCSRLPKVKNPGQPLELNTGFFELLQPGHVQRHSTGLCIKTVAIYRTAHRDNTSALPLGRIVAESRTFQYLSATRRRQPDPGARTARVEHLRQRGTSPRLRPPRTGPTQHVQPRTAWRSHPG